MLSFLVKNISTIIISVIVAAVIVMLIVKMYKDKKAGKSSCGGSCEHCAMARKCHSDK